MDEDSLNNAESRLDELIFSKYVLREQITEYVKLFTNTEASLVLIQLKLKHLFKNSVFKILSSINSYKSIRIVK